MPGAFISYRREDSAGHTGRLFDRLRAQLGRDRVFMDVTGIEAGGDFVETIEQAIGSCDVLLAVIGPDWLSCSDAKGQPRLGDPADFIRLEIAAALKRNVRIIPVLIAGARMPPAQSLPDDLKSLARRQATELRDTRWDADIADLIVALERVLGPQPRVARAASKRKLAFLLTGAVAAVLAVALPAERYFRRADAPSSPASMRAPVVPERVLNYSLTVRRNPRQFPDSTPLQLARERIFSAGDLVRFSFSGPQPGFLYVINESPADNERTSAFNILFPSLTSNNGSAQLAAGQRVSIPERGDGFELDAEEGAEKLWLVWSVKAIDPLEAVKRWANPKDRGEIKDAADINAVRNFLALHVTPAPDVERNDDAAQTTVKGRGDVFVKLVTLEHRQ